MADGPKHSDSHDHDHDHDHDHAAPGQSSHHGHHHGPVSHDRAFAIGVALNAGFVAVEIFFGWRANSVALVADATHNLGDVLGLLMAWGAAVLGRRPPNASRTYGWGRSTILASLFNAVVLLIGVGAIGLEAIQRLFSPHMVEESTVMVVAVIGIAINGGTALLFMRGREKDINIRATYLHMMADAAVSLGVAVSAGVIALTGWLWLDPATSLAIVGIIAIGTWGLLRDSTALVMDAVPPGIVTSDVRTYLTGIPGVAEIHDLHIWGLSTTESALTVHLVQEDGGARGCRPHEVASEIRSRFGIGHVTVQIEHATEVEWCRLRPEDVV